MPQQLQGMTDRLARYPEAIRQRRLPHPFTGFQVTAGDSFEQAVIHLLDVEGILVD